MKTYKIIQTEKELIWKALNLSGSKFKNWCTNPAEFVKNIETEISPFLKEKINMGNIMENYIFEMGQEKFKSFDFIKEKNTFQHLKYEFCFANIDGFLFEKETEQNLILEIKNTEIDDLDLLAETYKYQILYYCWFFGLKRAILLAFIKGWKLRTFEFNFNNKQISWAEQKVKEFHNFLNTNVLPEQENLNIKNSNQEFNESVDLINSDYETFKNWEKKIKKAETIIKDWLIENDKNLYETDKLSFIISETKPRKSLDKETLEQFLNSKDETIKNFEKMGEPTKVFKIVEK